MNSESFLTLDSNTTDTFKTQKGSKDIIKLVHVISVLQKLVWSYFLCAKNVHTAASESVKISTNDSVEILIDSLMIELVVFYLKEPKWKQACWFCADWPHVGYKLTSWNNLIVKLRNWSMTRT